MPLLRRLDDHRELDLMRWFTLQFVRPQIRSEQKMGMDSRVRKTICTAFFGILVGVLPPASATAAQCACDCDGDEGVTIDELILIVNVALGTVPVDECPIADTGDPGIAIDDLLSCVLVALNGCGPEATPTPTPSPSPTPTPTSDLAPPIPTTSRELREWLQAGYYRSWTAESARHRSAGPHGLFVRTFLNDIVFASLAAGNAQHPTGAALVKELYSGDRVTLWAVAIKVQDDSANGSGWYWWEGEGYAGLGVPICTSCHGSDYNGLTSRDYVLTPFPLQ